MNILTCLFIISFAYDLPLASFYTIWATVKLSDVMGVIFLLAYLGRRVIARGSVAYPRRLAKLLLAMFGIACFSSINTFFFMHEEKGLYVALGYCGYWLLKLALAVIYYIFIYDLALNRDNAGNYLVSIWLNGIFVSVYGLLQYLEIIPQFWGEYVLTPHAITSSLSFNHLHLGLHMAIIFFVTLGLFFKEKRGSLKLLYGLSLPLFFVIEAFSLTRGTFTGVLVSLMLWAVCTKGSLRYKSKHVVAAAVIFAFALAFLGSFDYLGERFNVYGLYEYVVQDYHGSAGEEKLTRALETRREVFEFFKDMILDRPQDYILGQGFMSSPMRYAYTGAHIEVFDYLHDSGIPGLLLYLWFVGSMLKLLWTQMYRKGDDWQPLYYSYFFGVIAILISSFTSSFLTVNHTVGNFFAFFLTTLAVIIASGQGRREAENLSPGSVPLIILGMHRGQ